MVGACSVRMTDKTIKVIGLLLLFTLVIAYAFKLVSPSLPVQTSSDNNVQADKQSSASLYRQASHSEGNPAPIPWQMESISIGDQILNSTTNEVDILNELRLWARKDPEAALIWGQQQTNNSERTEAL